MDTSLLATTRLVEEVPLFYGSTTNVALDKLRSCIPTKKINVLGQGGFGCVVSVGDEYAIKLSLRRGKLDRADLIHEQSVLQALRTASKILGTPTGLVIARAVQTCGTAQVLLMPRMDESLFSCLKNNGINLVDRYDSMARDLVEGLSFLHRLGFAHGDLKPANILRQGNSFFITDFGAAHEVHEDEGLRKGVHYYQCTWTYRSLASIVAGDTVPSTMADDMYALGVIFFEAMAKRFLLRSGISYEDAVHKVVYTLGRHALPSSLVDTPLEPLAPRLDRIEPRCRIDELVSAYIGKRPVDPVVMRIFRLCFAIEPVKDANELKRLIEGSTRIGPWNIEDDGLEVIGERPAKRMCR